MKLYKFISCYKNTNLTVTIFDIKLINNLSSFSYAERTIKINSDTLRFPTSNFNILQPKYSFPIEWELKQQ
jgi:hypothetical protein